MRIIEGNNVDLISPFPINEVTRTFGWMHCYRTFVESDDSPKEIEDYVRYMNAYLGGVFSWGIIDKNHLTNVKHEAPLVGLITVEPVIAPWNGNPRSGVLHVATARKAFRTGLVDEACLLVLKVMFEELPTVSRVSASMLEKNHPAKGLFKRLGFKFEGILQDAVMQANSPSNLVLFGLTRRNYNLWQPHQEQDQDGYSIPLEAQSEESQEVSSELPLKISPQPLVELPTPLE